MSAADEMVVSDLAAGRGRQVDARAAAAEVVEAHRQCGHPGADDGKTPEALLDLVIFDHDTCRGGPGQRRRSG